MLHIAIVHHHLRGGGITRVIGNAWEALRDRNVRIAVLVGEPPSAEIPNGLTVKVVPGLGYANCANATGAPTDASGLLSRVKAAARDALGRAPDVWHVHNHSLGKNPVVTHAVHALALEQAPLLLQIHDFPEDGRPANYRALADDLRQLAAAEGLKCLYPAGARVHYALLNQRDAQALSQAGLAEGRRHVLPNAVYLESSPGSAVDRAEDFIVYPTRAIRRKNLGEFLLWAVSALDFRFAVTLAPKNPDARPGYDSWVRFAEKAALPVTFEFGGHTDLSFPQVLASAAAVGTTSVGEGFGLAFLEPWLAGTPVIGRDLPDITRDFTDHGIDLNPLYERLDVPLEWVGEHALRDAFARDMARSWESYGRELTAEGVDRALASAVQDGTTVDFGRLDEPLQKRALTALQGDRDLQLTLRGRVLDGMHAGRALAERNVALVRGHFGLNAYGDKLQALYQTVADSPADSPQSLDPQRVLDAFLDPTSFMLLRT